MTCYVQYWSQKPRAKINETENSFCWFIRKQWQEKGREQWLLRHLSCKPTRYIRENIFFKHLFGCPAATFGALSRDSLIHPMLITVFLQFWSEGHRERRNEVGSSDSDCNASIDLIHKTIWLKGHVTLWMGTPLIMSPP